MTQTIVQMKEQIAKLKEDFKENTGEDSFHTKLRQTITEKIEYLNEYLEYEIELEKRSKMPPIPNNKPFAILIDPYDSECFYLYSVLRALFDYPGIDFDTDEHLGSVSGKLYASAFANICSNYLVDYIQMYRYDDFELFVIEMQFENDAQILKELAEMNGLIYNAPIIELVKNLITVFKNRIIVDINKLFPTNELKLQLFNSIFEMGKFKSESPTFSIHDEHPGLMFLQ
ncbi:MAG: hypothetical protein H7331_07095 [Bacteroidia bacterium]|nr:hypothetical protein [Bacteroidia bacterium]